MRRNEEAYFLDILIAAKEIKQFSAGLTREAFQESKLHQRAVTRSLEIIGEAASKISTATQNAHPEIPWHRIIGMRNRLIHEYFRIDLEKVWNVILNDLPKLMSSIEPLVPPEENS